MKYFKKCLPRKRWRMSKNILWFLIVLWLSGLVLPGQVGTPAEVHAQQTTTQTATTETSDTGSMSKIWLIALFDIILKVIYVILWPLLVVAGWAMDNSLIYGSIFHLDVPLWKFWNVIKNFANFTLWFLVIFSILKYIIKKWSTSPLSIIKSTLIAGILIQASRFILAAVIDVSTVATYAVGGLPLNVIKGTDLGDKKILATDTQIDFNKKLNFNDPWEMFIVTYAAGTHKLSACKIMNDNCGSDNDSPYRYIVWRKQIGGTEMGKCVLGGNMIIPYNETDFRTDGFFTSQTTDYETFVQWPSQLCISPSQWETWTQKGFVVDIYSESSFSPAKKEWETWFSGTAAMKLSELVNKSKGFVWPLAMIYSSLLNFAGISDAGTESFGTMSGEMMIRTWFAIMLIFPLIALAVVLILRVGFLWVVIIGSPFIILAESFKELIPKVHESLKKHFSLRNIFSIIFAPVVTVFALSMALIFISTLINTFNPKSSGSQDTSPNLMQALEPQVQKVASEWWTQKYIIGGSEMELKNFNRWGWLDRFSWLVVNLMAVGLMRWLVFTAIKANSLGDKFGWGIQKFGGNLLSTLPIFSIPGSWDKKVGIWSIAKVLKNTPDEYISHISREQEDVAEKVVNKAFNISDGQETSKMSTQEINSLITTATKTPEEVAKIPNIATTVDNNSSAIYEAIMNDNGIENPDNVLKTIWERTEDREWYKKIAKDQFEKAILISKDSTKESIETSLKDEKNSKAVKNYFKVETTYNKEIEGKKFSITNNGEWYTVTAPEETKPDKK